MRQAGDRPMLRSDDDYRRPEEAAVAFYGFEKNTPRIMAEFKRAGKPVVFVDLGYWQRKGRARWDGYHKVAVNDRHPTAHFQRCWHDDSRLRRFGVKMQPWRTAGAHILIAGMSARSAASYGLAPEEWERRAVAELTRHTERPLIYRPKPSWREARPIDGTRFSPKAEPLAEVLENCHAVVTHHSNVAVDALVMGVPVFCKEGVAAPMGLRDLGWIEAPHYPEDRVQWAADVAWCQWSLEEMRSGAMWRHLKDEGLVP